MQNLDLKIIQHEVESVVGFEINFNCRIRQHVYARSICFVMARYFTKLSFREIGEFYGDRDHATVLHGCTKSEKEYIIIPEYRRNLAKCRVKLSPYFPMQLNNKAITKAKNFIEALDSAEKYKAMYHEQLIENERLKLLIESESITTIDKLVSSLTMKEIEELKKYRILPFLKMRGKLNNVL